jgi:cbb3-type cytochrome oxidase maturation protein
MDIIIVLISVSLSIALGFLVLFVWNVKSGQYDDTYTPSVRILFGDKKKEPKNEKRESSVQGGKHSTFPVAKS